MALFSRPGFPARLTAYLLLVGACFEAIVFLLMQLGWEGMFLEGGFVEWGQILALCLASLGLLLLTFFYKSRRGIFGLLATRSLLGLCRELTF